MKKLLILILILTLVMTAFTACGGKDNGEKVIEEQTVQAEQSGEDSDADADAEPEDKDKDLKAFCAFKRQ